MEVQTEPEIQEGTPYFPSQTSTSAHLEFDPSPDYKHSSFDFQPPLNSSIQPMIINKNQEDPQRVIVIHKIPTIQLTNTSMSKSDTSANRENLIEICNSCKLLIDNDSVDTALTYLQQAEKSISLASKIGKPIQPQLVQSILHNESVCFMLNHDWQHSQACLQLLINQLSHTLKQIDSNSLITHRMLTTKLTLARYYLNYCIICSQVENHTAAIISARKANIIMRELFKQFSVYMSRTKLLTVRNAEYQQMLTMVSSLSQLREVSLEDYAVLRRVVQQEIGDEEFDNIRNNQGDYDALNSVMYQIFQLLPREHIIPQKQTLTLVDSLLVQHKMQQNIFLLASTYFLIGQQLLQISKQQKSKIKKGYQISETNWEFKQALTNYIFAILVLSQFGQRNRELLNEIIVNYRHAITDQACRVGSRLTPISNWKSYLFNSKQVPVMKHKDDQTTYKKQYNSSTSIKNKVVSMDNKREEGFNLKKPKLTKEMNKIIKIVDWLDQHQLKSKCFTDISERGEASELSKVEISKNKNISVKRKKIQPKVEQKVEQKMEYKGEKGEQKIEQKDKKLFKAEPKQKSKVDQKKTSKNGEKTSKSTSKSPKDKPIRTISPKQYKLPPKKKSQRKATDGRSQYYQLEKVLPKKLPSHKPSSRDRIQQISLSKMCASFKMKQGSKHSFKKLPTPPPSQQKIKTARSKSSKKTNSKSRQPK